MTHSKNYSGPIQGEFPANTPTDPNGDEAGYIHGQRDEGYRQARRRSQQKTAYRGRTAKGAVDALVVGGAIALSAALVGASAYIFSQGSFSLPDTSPRTTLPDDSLQKRSLN